MSAVSSSIHDLVTSRVYSSYCLRRCLSNTFYRQNGHDEPKWYARSCGWSEECGHSSHGGECANGRVLCRLSSLAMVRRQATSIHCFLLCLNKDTIIPLFLLFSHRWSYCKFRIDRLQGCWKYAPCFFFLEAGDFRIVDSERIPLSLLRI
jgi:hypothetical protein